jgi:pimeloyl-ACP methyl ester carboxylesterase
MLPAPPVSIVLVHGALVDGSSWRGGVYDTRIRRRFRVAVVQPPLKCLDDDVAATKRAIDQQEGPVALVCHSYGGAIRTVADTDGRSEQPPGDVRIEALAASLNCQGSASLGDRRRSCRGSHEHNRDRDLTPALSSPVVMTSLLRRLDCFRGSVRCSIDGSTLAHRDR